MERRECNGFYGRHLQISSYRGPYVLRDREAAYSRTPNTVLNAI